jgi:branched-chain amino acid transport system substrate-binding protein
MLRIFVAAFLAVAAPIRAETGISRSEIVLGQAAALGGPAQGLGQGMNAGLRAAFDEVNAKGGIHGRRLRLVSVDDGYESERTVERTVHLLDAEKVFALVGYVGTPTGKVAAAIAQEMHAPLVGIFSGAMLLRKPVQRYVVNVRASYDDETEALVDHLGGRSRLALIYQNDAFGLAGLSGVEKALARRKMELVGRGSFERNTLAVKGAVAQVAASHPDAVIIVGPYKPTAAAVREARAAGLTAQMATISFVGTENLIAELGPEAEGMLISQVVPPPDDMQLPIVAQYARAMPAAVGRSFVSLEGYITGRFFIAALEAAGPKLTRENLVDAIEASSNLDLDGFKLSFGKEEHQGSRRVFLTRVEGGKARSVPALHAAR